MRVALLGPLRVRAEDGTPVEVGGARLRALLARLALDPGRFVPAGALVDALWGAEPPSDANNALQSLVSRLRKALRPAELLESGPAGYRLALDPGEVDVCRFESLAAQARADLHPARAFELLTEALDLWHGPPLADLVDAPFADPARVRLTQARLAAVEDRADAGLATGRAGEVLAELDALAAEHPLRETLAARRVRALHAAGRTADALAAYERVRRELADALGVDPSPELREAHLAVLREEATPRPAAPRLPAQVTSFVGRGADLARLRDLLDATRLVTLVGPGGAGKTRLSAVAAGQWAEREPDPVWFVELAPVDADTELAPVLLSAIGARDVRILDTGPQGTPPRDPADRLSEAMSGRSGLLVLDNCEHVIGRAAALVSLLLDRCPKLRVLATSREPLAIAGETLHWVGPLELPAEPVTLPTAVSAAAVRMFVDRAAAARPGFTLDEVTLPAVAEIVRRMDGMPLALELAAARLRSMTPAQVVERLDDRFRLLTGGSRVALPRHRTLRGVIEWSWDLLTEPERMLARRLAVFADGADEAGAVGVCAGAGLAAADVPYLLASLVEKSLVHTVEAASGPRYRLLETVRAYGAEKLAEAGEKAAVWGAFSEYFATFLDNREPLLRTADQLLAIAEINREHDNVLAAVRYAVDTRDAETGARLAMGMSWYWLLVGRSREIAPLTNAVREVHNGPLSETMAALTACALIAAAESGEEIPAGQIQQALAACRDTEAEHRFPLLGIAEPMLAMFMGDPARAYAAADRSADRRDPWAAACGQLAKVFIAENEGDLVVAEAALDAALPVFRELGERWGIAMCRSMQGNFAWLRGELDAAFEAGEEALKLVTELGSTDDTPVQLTWLGRMRADYRDLDGADRDLTTALADAERSGALEAVLMIRCELVKLASARGELDRARRYLAEAEDVRFAVNGLPAEHRLAMLGLSRTVLNEAEGDLTALAGTLAETLPAALGSRDMPLMAQLAERTARLHLLRGEPRPAAELLGTAERLRGLLNQGDYLVRRTVAELAEVLGAEAYAEALRHGTTRDKPAAVTHLADVITASATR